MPPQIRKWKFKPMRILLRSLVITFAMTWLGACSFVGFPGVYKIDVEQGNIVTPEMVGQLKPGMSRRQVRFILGTPLLEELVLLIGYYMMVCRFLETFGVEVEEGGPKGAEITRT